MILFLKTYKKTILTSAFLLVVSLFKLPSADDILNLLWVDVVPIHPSIENSIVNISNTPNVDKYEHCFFYAILAFILWLEIPRKLRKKQYTIIFSYAFSLGVLIELLQGLTPHRSTNVLDILANTCGIGITLIFILIISLLYERKRKNLSDSAHPSKRCWPCQCKKFDKLFWKC